MDLEKIEKIGDPKKLGSLPFSCNFTAFTFYEFFYFLLCLLTHLKKKLVLWFSGKCWREDTQHPISTKHDGTDKLQKATTSYYKSSVLCFQWKLICCFWFYICCLVLLFFISSFGLSFFSILFLYWCWLPSLHCADLLLCKTVTLFCLQ